MAVFFIFVTNLLSLYQRTLLMHKLLSDYTVLRKQNQMNFDRKNCQNQFLPILPATQEQKLEKNLPDVFK